MHFKEQPNKESICIQKLGKRERLRESKETKKNIIEKGYDPGSEIKNDQ